MKVNCCESAQQKGEPMFLNMWLWWINVEKKYSSDEIYILKMLEAEKGIYAVYLSADIN